MVQCALLNTEGTECEFKVINFKLSSIKLSTLRFFYFVWNFTLYYSNI